MYAVTLQKLGGIKKFEIVSLFFIITSCLNCIISALIQPGLPMKQALMKFR